VLVKALPDDMAFCGPFSDAIIETKVQLDLARGEYAVKGVVWKYFRNHEAPKWPGMTRFPT